MILNLLTRKEGGKECKEEGYEEGLRQRRIV
jgi:hypothetical protein